MARQVINFGVTGRKVRVQPSMLPQNFAGSALTVGQNVFGVAGSGAAFTPRIFDRVFAVLGGSGAATKIAGGSGNVIAAWAGSFLSVMAKMAVGGVAGAAGELSFLFSDSQETIAGVDIDTDTLFSLLIEAEDLPAVAVPAGTNKWTVVRNIEVGHARFILPQFRNVGTQTSGAWRIFYTLHDRTG